jgi:hypothetical protein
MTDFNGSQTFITVFTRAECTYYKKEKKKQKYIGVCWPIAKTICKALHGKIIFFPHPFSVQSDEMHTEESSTTPQTNGRHRVLRQFVTHTHLLVRSE